MQKVAVIGNGIAQGIARAAEIVDTFKEKIEEVKAEQEGVGRSRARLLIPARHVPDFKPALKHRTGVPRPIPGANVRMLDGKLMKFFDDGSVRHAYGAKPGKAARKALKRQRREQAKKVKV